MKRKVLLKQAMIVVGILAAFIILLSPVVQKEACSFLSDMKSSETKRTPEKDIPVITVHSDAVTSAQACEMEDADPAVIREIILEEGHQPKQPTLSKTVLTSFVKTLLRTVISPQAP